MKKNILLLLFVFFIVKKNNAQVNEYEYKFTYDVVFQTDSTDLSTRFRENVVLLEGKKMSLYISPTRIFIDSMRNVIKKRGGSVSELIEYKNRFPKNEITYSIKKKKHERKMVYQNKNLIKYIEYEEDLHPFKWRIENKRKQILGYNCQLATINYKGRDFTAWFSLEIPVQNGPWKFGGLPGLIMEIMDSRGHYVFTLKGIEKVKNKFPASIKKSKIIRTTKKDYSKVVKNSTNEFTQIFIGSSKKRIKKKLKEKTKNNKNPIELEI